MIAVISMKMLKNGSRISSNGEAEKIVESPKKGGKQDGCTRCRARDETAKKKRLSCLQAGM